jgi:hypothetical protein
MYTFYLDKQNVFECQVQIEGADINNSKSRLLLENNKGITLLFNGTLDGDGNCLIPLEDIKQHLKENSKGNLKLEIIVDDTLFTPYESPFNTEISKKVTISEVKHDKSNPNKKRSPKINVNIKNQPSPIKEENIYEPFIKEFIIFNQNALELTKKDKIKRYNFEQLLEYYLDNRFKGKPKQLIREVKKSILKNIIK